MDKNTNPPVDFRRALSFSVLVVVFGFCGRWILTTGFYTTIGFGLLQGYWIVFLKQTYGGMKGEKSKK